MAVYRERHRRPRWLWLLAVAGLLLVVSLAWLALRPKASSDTSPQTALDQIAAGLDLFSIEYPKAARGEPSGAAGALDRVRRTFDAARPALAARDAAATARLETDLQTVADRLAAKAPPEQVQPVIDDALAAIRGLRAIP